MPVGRRPGAGTHDYVRLKAPGWLIRVIEGKEGRVTLDVTWRPAVDFARRPARLVPEPGVVKAGNGKAGTPVGGPCLHHDMRDLHLAGDMAHARIEIAAGARRTLVLTPRPAEGGVLDQAERLRAVTEAFWREWIGYCRYKGPYAAAVQRSALALKLLTYAPTGAIVAAPTTSLPEALGGDRNWDYRYCWLRDSAFTLYALAVLGYSGEARHFVRFLVRACAASHPDLQIMYGIDAEPDLEEQILGHLDGYAGSRPVRTGNGAYRQRQIDVYGEVLDAAMIYKTLGGRIDGAPHGMLEAAADFVAAHWLEPDQGLWEMRGPPRHYTHSKAMSWVALDRACRLLGARPHWEGARDAILEDITSQAVDPASKHLVQAYGRPGTDAALLLLPLVALPLDRRTLEATVAAVERELRHGPFVYRYKSDDGLAGTEGAFFICSFWLVDALLVCGRHDEAKALFEHLLARANDVGLYAEEIDPESGAFLGNFPQAFTHLALIGAAAHLDLYEKGGMNAVIGSHADRARRQVTATFGWRALWAAIKATRRAGRILPSRRSVLDDALIGNHARESAVLRPIRRLLRALGRRQGRT
jgi:alpha,alpha-trehalase